MKLSFEFTRLLFEFFYRIARYQDGSLAAPVKRCIESLGEEQIEAYERVHQDALARGRNALIEYDLRWPKVSFLNYLCDRCGYVAHGSIRQDLEVLEPVRLSTDESEFGGGMRVFGTPDAVWALWFAILDKRHDLWTRNDCTRLGPRDGAWVKYYHFDLPKAVASTPPFSNGMVYLLSAANFQQRHQKKILEIMGAEFEEWGSSIPMDVMIKVPVSPEDFPYMDRVEYTLGTSD